MDRFLFRTCGICGVTNIPRGVEWPFWHDGRPVHIACLATENPPERRTLELIYAQIENAIHNIGLLPKSRETEMAVTKLDEAWMWLNRIHPHQSKTAAGSDTL